MVSATLQKNDDLASLDERLALVVGKLKKVDLLTPTASFNRLVEEDAPTLSNPSCDEEVSSRHISAKGDQNFQKPRSVNSPKGLKAYHKIFSGSAKSLPPPEINDLWSNPSSTSSVSKFKLLGVNSPLVSNPWSIPAPSCKSQGPDTLTYALPTWTLAEQLKRMQYEYKNKLQQVELNRRQLQVKIGHLDTNKRELRRLKRQLQHKHEKHIVQCQEEKVKLKHKHKQLTVEKRVVAKKSLDLEERDLQLLNKLDILGESCRYTLDESTKERWDCRVHEEWQDYIKEKDKFTTLHAAVAEQKNKAEGYEETVG